LHARRLRRVATTAVIAGATLVYTAPPSSADQQLCGYIRVNGVDLWPGPHCDPPCTGILLVDVGVSRDTMWTYLCLA
jgi:hypothetical protein